MNVKSGKIWLSIYFFRWEDASVNPKIVPFVLEQKSVQSQTVLEPWLSCHVEQITYTCKYTMESNILDWKPFRPGIWSSIGTSVASQLSTSLASKCGRAGIHFPHLRSTRTLCPRSWRSLLCWHVCWWRCWARSVAVLELVASWSETSRKLVIPGTATSRLCVGSGIKEIAWVQTEIC